MKIRFTAIAFLAVVFLTFSASAQRIALIKGDGHAYHELDGAFANAGWKPIQVMTIKKFVNGSSVLSIPKFLETIDSFDFVFTDPAVNTAHCSWNLPDEEVDYSLIKRYLENGGLIYVTDVNHTETREWLTNISKDFGGLRSGGCTSTRFTINGHMTNDSPVHPLNGFPYVITAADFDSHFEEPAEGSKWKVVSRCSQGKPVVMMQDVGKGAIAITSLRPKDDKIFQNCYTYARMARAGIKAKTMSISEITAGKVQIRMVPQGEIPANTMLFFEIQPDEGEKQRFEKEVKTGEECVLDMIVTQRGKGKAVVGFDVNGKREVVHMREIVIPQLLTVGPNAYRGILSKNRRFGSVNFPVLLAPAKEDITGAKVELEVYDANGAKVSSAMTNAPASFDGPCKIWTPVPLSRDLPAGEYKIHASLAKGSIKCESEDKFKILAVRAAQTIIDDDGTFLVGGKPFFPLGIYHIKGDYEKVAKIGFNSCQFWRFNLNFDEYGSSTGLYLASGNKLKCLFESNFGGGMLAANARDFADHPAILMWYNADEPLEGSEAGLKFNYEAYRDNDEQHPVFLMACRPDLFHLQAPFSDVLAFNIFRGIKGMTEVIEKARTVTDGRKSLIVLNGAFPNDPLQLRYHAYAAYTHGINGIFWYCWSQHAGGAPGIGLHDHYEDQEEMKRVCAEARIMTGALTSTYRRMFVDGDVHGIVCGTEPGNRYVILANVMNNDAECNVTIPELKGLTEVELPFDKCEMTDDGPVYTGKKIPISSPTVKHSFKPYQEYVLRF